MNIEDLTIAQVREIASLLNLPQNITNSQTKNSHPYPVGKYVFIRTVTMYYTGHLVCVHDGELVLRDAAWIPDCGRFSEAIASGKLNEVEPYPDNELVIVSRGAVLDVVEWNHPLPRNVK